MRAEQQSLRFQTWGGQRPGAGRKPGARRDVHARRPDHRGYQPVHLTLRVQAGLPNLRTQGVAQLLRRAFRHSRREWFRIVHFSIQTNHLHLLVEAPDRSGLSRGASGLVIRCARRLNQLLQRRGGVFPCRFHARALATPREVRNALIYILHNARRHGARLVGIDPLSSGAVFDGWSDVARSAVSHEMYARYGVSPPTTWLARVGWRKHALIATWEAPAGGRRTCPLTAR